MRPIRCRLVLSYRALLFALVRTHLPALLITAIFGQTLRPFGSHSHPIQITLMVRFSDPTRRYTFPGRLRIVPSSAKTACSLCPIRVRYRTQHPTEPELFHFNLQSPSARRAVFAHLHTLSACENRASGPPSVMHRSASQSHIHDVWPSSASMHISLRVARTASSVVGAALPTYRDSARDKGSIVPLFPFPCAWLRLELP